MPIEAHLMDDEEVKQWCITDQWSWVATNQRIIKYRESGSTLSDLHDLSYDEISAISLTKDEQQEVAGLGILLMVAGYFLFDHHQLGAIVSGAIGALMVLGWMFTEGSSHFEFRGNGLLEKEPNQWKLKADAHPDDAREFVKAVRSQL